MAKPLDMPMVLRSDFRGFYLRLKKLGYMPGVMWTKPYTLPGIKHSFLRSYWTFKNEPFKVVFIISPHGCSFYVRKGEDIDYKHSQSVCSSHLEDGFLKYFKQNTPLTLQRLSIGQQNPKVSKWMKKLRQKEKKATASQRSKAKSGMLPKEALPIHQVKKRKRDPDQKSEPTNTK